jgi:hypothetical protein
MAMRGEGALKCMDEYESAETLRKAMLTKKVMHYDLLTDANHPA